MHTALLYCIGECTDIACTFVGGGLALCHYDAAVASKWPQIKPLASTHQPRCVDALPPTAALAPVAENNAYLQHR
jgi:hypothetical protein